jgi:hypothetical protein
MKVLSAGMAMLAVAVLVVGVALAGANSRGNATATGQGLMPEVTATAEMPRLVMPTVEVRAVRTVAMGGLDLLVN